MLPAVCGAESLEWRVLVAFWSVPLCSVLQGCGKRDDRNGIRCEGGIAREGEEEMGDGIRGVVVVEGVDGGGGEGPEC